MTAGRAERVAEEIRLAIGEALIRGEIKDPRVRDAGIITITHVKVTGDLHQARALFMVYDADEAKLLGVRDALNKAGGFWRRKIAERLRLKFTPTLTFEVDRVFESEARVERALQDIAAAERERAQQAAEAADPEAADPAGGPAKDG